MYLIGYDSGTSSIKATIVDSQTGEAVASANWPEKEMQIISHQAGWAEQNPQDWWENLKTVTKLVIDKSGVSGQDIKAIGMTYQMHGLVCVDKDLNVLRPSIIWCDSRAVQYGAQAAAKIGSDKCLESLLNLPGNFTAAKLGWVKDNEPDIYNQIYKVMLPGDYLSMKLTGQVNTTVSGLSEGIFWDFKENKLSDDIFDAFGFDRGIMPETVDTFANQGQLLESVAAELGLKAGTPVAYRAGDQPNNAFSLNVLNPGEIAATAGTSGVVYGVADKVKADQTSRVNSFVHVNHKADARRYGVLLCINGTGILNSWLKHNVGGGLDYPEMDKMADSIAVGSDGLRFIPFGNGAERTLENKNVFSSLMGLDFNRHTTAHMFRAAQEGIVFAFNYGLDIMRAMGIEIATVRAGHANMFMSNIFSESFANITGSSVELYDTDGSLGAARGAGVGAGIYSSFNQAFESLEKKSVIEPDNGENTKALKEAYEDWKAKLGKLI